MKKISKDMLNKLFPLFLILCTIIGGFFLIVFRQQVYEGFEQEINLKTHNAIARMVIGEAIVVEIQKLETLFYKLTISINEQQQHAIIKDSHKSIENIQDFLNVLEKGGTVVQNIPLNLIDTDEMALVVSYQPNHRQYYIVEILELRPALVEIAEKMEQMHQIIALRNQMFLEVDTSEYSIKNGKNIRRFVKKTDSIFSRITENGYKLFFDGRKNLMQLGLESDRKKEAGLREYYHVALVVGCLVLLLIGFVLRQIFHTREVLEQSVLDLKKTKKDLQVKNIETKQFNDTLEKQVVERTESLSNSNEKLLEEIQVRQKIEDILRKSENRFRDISQSMADWIWEVDANGKYVYVSDTVKKVLGYSSEELIGKTFFQFLAEEDNNKPANLFYEIISKSKAIVDLENWFIAKDGSKVCMLSNGVPIKDTDGNISGYRGVDKNITGQKKLEDELFQARKMESMGTLAGGIAHDFNNILTAIIGYSELIQQEIPPDSIIAQDIAQVLVSSKRAADLVKQILTFSRKTNMAQISFRPHFIVEEAVKMLRSTFPTTVSIEQDIDPDCGVILAVPTNIHQIVVNLCTNGLHALPDQKGIVSVSLKRVYLNANQLTGESFLSPGNFIALTVSDTGSGMEKKIIDRIFDPYFTTKEVGKGSGLGLAVIYGIMHDSHGFVKVRSAPGEGSTFEVYFPVSQEESLLESDSAQKIFVQGRGEHILVVDDEELLVRAIKRQLEHHGYKVTITTDSKDALELIRTNPEQFDLLITDQTMPGLAGSELALEAMKIKMDLPVILCSGHSEMVSKEKALELGIRKYVAKPIIDDKLCRAVRLVLDGETDIF